MQLNKYNLGDVVMVQGAIREIHLTEDGKVEYKIHFSLDKFDYIDYDYALVSEEIVTPVF